MSSNRIHWLQPASHFFKVRYIHASAGIHEFNIICIHACSNNGRSWKIDDLSACNDSFPCFTDCIKRSVGYTLVENCDENNQYELYCRECMIHKRIIIIIPQYNYIEFDKSLDGVYSAGNKYICTYEAGKQINYICFIV